MGHPSTVLSQSPVNVFRQFFTESNVRFVTVEPHISVGNIRSLPVLSCIDRSSLSLPFAQSNPCLLVRHRLLSYLSNPRDKYNARDG